MKAAASTDKIQTGHLKRSLLLVASYLALMFIIAGAYS